jgi:hypothetical protein
LNTRRSPIGASVAIPIIVAALLALFTGVVPGFVTPSAAHAATVTCTPYEILGSRGSGQAPQPTVPPDSTQGFGTQAYAFATSFVSLAGLSLDPPGVM